MKIDVGMYVRTDCGITKIKEVTKNFVVFDKNVVPDIECMTNECLKDDIEKWIDIIGEPSYNPINLIEVGDYVNGHEIIEKINDTIYIESSDYIDGKTFILNSDIKSIVTKEQFEQMSYKVEV